MGQGVRRLFILNPYTRIETMSQEGGEGIREGGGGVKCAITFFVETKEIL